MKQLFAACALSSLVLLPATSAWADGTAGESGARGTQAQATLSSADGQRLIASGCHDGVVFVFDYSTGTTTTGGRCTDEAISHYYVFG
jgi:hypothetical protein